MAGKLLYLRAILVAIWVVHSTWGADYYPLTPSEWSQVFQCPTTTTTTTTTLTNNSSQLACHQLRAQQTKRICGQPERDVCSRDPQAWMWKYVDELEPEFQVLIREESADQRLANIIYTVVTTRAVHNELHRIEANDQQSERQLELSLIGGQVNESRCGEQLRQMVELMKQFNATYLSEHKRTREPLDEQYIRLARVLDSYGRYMSGMMSGKQYLIGYYDQCLNTQLLLPWATTNKDQKSLPKELVQMRYCWATVSLEQSLSLQLSKRKRFHYEQGQTALQVAICLPETCHSNSFLQHPEPIQELLNSQLSLPGSIYLREHLNISSIHCIADDQSPMLKTFPTSGRLLMGFIGLWLLLVVFATIYTERKLPEKANYSWLSCISFVRNLDDFLELNDTKNVRGQKPPSTDIDVLNPIKCFACLWATMVHAILALHFMSNALLRDHKLIDTDRAMTLIITSPLVVETYFVLSGLLLTYLTLRRMNRVERVDDINNNNNNNNNNNHNHNHELKLEISEPSRKELNQQVTTLPVFNFFKSCLAIIASRYLRLVPLFYLMFWFKKSLMTFVHLGPFWNHGLNRAAGGQCQHNSWWSPLSLSSVYEPILEKCLPQSYTITSELIFVLLAAPLIVLIDKYPRSIIGLMTTLALASTWAAMGAIVSLDKAIWWDLSDLRSWGLFQLFSRPMSHIYTSPEYRLFSILFGIFTGWLVYKFEQLNLQDKSHYMRKFSLLLNWLTIFSILFPLWTFLAGAYRNELKQLAEPYHRHLFPYQFVLTRLMWALSSAIICLRLLTDWNHPNNLINWWTTSKFWRILSKLNYSILLIHLDLLFFDWQFSSHETIIIWYKLISLFISVYAFSIALAIVIHVLIESPLNKLIKRFVV